MKLFSFIVFSSIATIACSVANAQQDYLKAFPAAEEGMARHVIRLPHKERGEENDFQVEIIVGKKMLTDGVNRLMIGGRIEAKPLKGWGFTFYQVEKFGAAASTLIGVPPGTPQVEKFVSVPPLMIRYNSRVPIVVYVPTEGEVRYRIWKAGESETAKEG
ncbi:MAG: ecotin family protein [bacterium]|nr:ecotin family protein [bacterium]